MSSPGNHASTPDFTPHSLAGEPTPVPLSDKPRSSEKAMEHTPQCWLHRDLSEELALAIGKLMASTWKNPEKNAEVRAAKLIDLGNQQIGPAELASRSWVLMDGDLCIAHAAMQPREIRLAGQPTWIMGLGAVCTDADRRGQGLGATIVRAAFGMIDDGLASFSLFQTSNAVQPFYENLGACKVENPIVDSTADDPTANPFWDDVVMRYPSGGNWPAGTIDLAGPGY